MKNWQICLPDIDVRHYVQVSVTAHLLRRSKMTIPTETATPILGMTPRLSQEQFLSDQQSETLVKKYKKLKRRNQKLKEEIEIVRKQNAELIKINEKANANKLVWKTISNSAPKLLQLLSDVFNANHSKKMLEKNMSMKKHNKHKKKHKKN